MRRGAMYVTGMVLFLATAATIVPQNAEAQDRNFPRITIEYDEVENPMLNVSNCNNGIYTLLLDFGGSKNIALPKLLRLNVRKDGQIVTIRPLDGLKPWRYHYSQYLRPGDVNPSKIDSAYVYRLPFKTSAQRETANLTGIRLDSTDVNYCGVGFRMNRGDSICAARKGTVIYTQDDFEPFVYNNGVVMMQGRDNRLWIQHDDGTVADYNLLEKNSIKVKVGDVVEAGQPIAVTGTLDNKIWFLYFYVFYQTDNLFDIDSGYDYVLFRNYMNPIFDTSTGQITVNKKAYYSHPLKTTD